MALPSFPLLRPPLLIGAAPWVGLAITSDASEPLDAPDDLRRQTLSQLAFGQPTAPLSACTTSAGPRTSGSRRAKPPPTTRVL